jgi:Holliday junction resolvase RusA-like endonuclease
MENDPYQDEFFVAGDPVPQSRPRVTRTGHVYYASRIVRYRKAVELAARAAGLPLRDGPLWLGIECVFERPKSHKKASGGLKPDAPAFPFHKGDCSNLAKGIEDSLENVAYRSDAQVVELQVRRRYARGDEQAGAHITICDVEPLPDAIRKRARSVNKSWTVAERNKRDTTRSDPLQIKRMIEYRELLDDTEDNADGRT